MTGLDAVRSLVIVRPPRFCGLLSTVVVAVLLALTASAAAGKTPSSTVRPQANSVTYKVPKAQDQ